MTPQIEGIKKQIIESPEGGWQPNTWYIAEVASGLQNVFHQTLVFSGEEGTVESARIINPTYDVEVNPLADRFVVRNIQTIGKLASMKAPTEEKIIPRAYYVASIDRGDKEPVIGLAYTGFLNGRNGTPGGYSFTYVEGDKSADAYDYRSVKLLHLIITENELDGEDDGEDWED